MNSALYDSSGNIYITDQSLSDTSLNIVKFITSPYIQWSFTLYYSYSGYNIQGWNLIPHSNSNYILVAASKKVNTNYYSCTLYFMKTDVVNKVNVWSYGMTT